MPRERLLALLIVAALAGALVLAVAVLTEPADDLGTRSRSGGDAPQGAVDRARVVRVADGDTVTVEIDGRRERVRYVGVDAPEVANADTGAPAECGAERARDANLALVAEREIVLEHDVTDRDRFGRLLRHPWLQRDDGWLLVTEALVAEGAVEARAFRPDTLHDDRLDAAERAARARGIGIWSSC